MNPEVKKSWLEALRSGEYKQGKKALRIEDKFCCLGVLCDLYLKGTNNHWEKSKINALNGSYLEENYLYVIKDSGNESGILPETIMIWADLDDKNPIINLPEKPLSLASLNDSGKSFPEIADLIEKHL